MRSRTPKLITLALVLYAVVCMWHWPIGFTFFTQLSNLFAAAAVLLQLIAGEGRFCAVKYASTVSILVTFLVFLVFMGPFYPGGLWAAYRQDHCASLCMHLLVPCAMLTDHCLNDRKVFLGRRWPLYALLPPLLWYGAILILGAAGMRWRGMAAPYPFLDHSAPAGWFGLSLKAADGALPGIGVFYSVLAMSGLFLLTGRLLLHKTAAKGGLEK